MEGGAHARPLAVGLVAPGSPGHDNRSGQPSNAAGQPGKIPRFKRGKGLRKGGNEEAGKGGAAGKAAPSDDAGPGDGNSAGRKGSKGGKHLPRKDAFGGKGKDGASNKAAPVKSAGTKGGKHRDSTLSKGSGKRKGRRKGEQRSSRGGWVTEPCLLEGHLVLRPSYQQLLVFNAQGDFWQVEYLATDMPPRSWEASMQMTSQRRRRSIDPEEDEEDDVDVNEEDQDAEDTEGGDDEEVLQTTEALQWLRIQPMPL
eukprot:TRINITY_DN95068_c0_g1_i1.p1 TRINITY_DN95068_c0_g1~~TRINITY_DN95068_c0_g1_i1.p1  ORF type:complete len:255 (-),score=66.22 TRINITY_DN95068_c0_g1_i1:98-862(-)